MPYDASDVAGLPKNVQEMSDHDRRQWCHIWNSAYERHGDEGLSFREANGVLKKQRGQKPTEEEAKGIADYISHDLGIEIEVKGLETEEEPEIEIEEEEPGFDLEGIETKKFALDETNSTEVSFRVRSDAAITIPKLLDYIARLGAPGHSFSIVVDPDDSENRRSFGFDGDGADRIDDIRVNGKKFESKD